MKKIISYMLVLCLLLGMNVVPVFGTSDFNKESIDAGFAVKTGDTATIQGIASSNAAITTTTASIGNTEYTYYPGSDQLAVSIPATNGAFYLVLLYDQPSEGTKLPTSSSKIYYIDQKTASGSAVDFKVYPILPTQSTALNLTITSNQDASKFYDVGYNLSTPPYTFGDLNNDGEINADDGLLILRYWAKLTVLSDAQKLAADLNNDHEINADDCLRILRYWAKLDTLLINY